MQPLSQPPHATRSHTFYMHVSLIMHSDPPAATVCGTGSHCGLPPLQTPLLEIGLLPPTFSRLLQIFPNNIFRQLQSSVSQNSVASFLPLLCAGLGNLRRQTHQHKLHPPLLLTSLLRLRFQLEAQLSTLNSSILYDSHNQPALEREKPKPLYTHTNTRIFSRLCLCLLS